MILRRSERRMERVYTRVLRVVLLLGTLQVLAIYSVMTSLLSFAAAAAAPYSHRKPTNKPTFDFVHSTCRRQRTRTLLHFITFFLSLFLSTVIVSQCRSFPSSHSAYLLYRCIRSPRDRDRGRRFSFVFSAF